MQERDNLKESKHAERSHVFACAERLETDERYLHTADQTDYVERTVRCEGRQG